MANELLSALETRVNSAVDTIDSLRGEIRELRAERQMLEDKLRELLDRMGIVEGNDGATSVTPKESNADAGAATGAPDNVASIAQGTGLTESGNAAAPSASATRFGTYGYGSGRGEY